MDSSTSQNFKSPRHWRNYFYNIGLQEDLVKPYLKYVDKLYQQKLPVIFESKHFSKLIGRSHSFVITVGKFSGYFYREFELKKRSGGKRIISVPMPSMLEPQKWIKSNILDKSKPHFTAHGFNRNKSIVTNAKVHLGQNCILKIDLTDFFPNTKINSVVSFFHSLGYTKKVSYILASFCCLNDSLPQGAPTSPQLSNLINVLLDKRLFKLARRFDYKYTRYADDLTFSGKDIPYKFISYVENIVNEHGYDINKDKTLLKKGNGKKLLLEYQLVEIA